MAIGQQKMRGVGIFYTCSPDASIFVLRLRKLSSRNLAPRASRWHPGIAGHE